MKVEKIDEGALKITTPGGLRLGFPTGIGTRRFSRADTVALRNSQGFIIGPEGKTEPWPVEKFVESEGDMVAIGPWVEDTRPFDSMPASPAVLMKMLYVMRALKTAGYPMKGIYSRAIRWLPDGGILVFPPKLAEWVRELSPEEKWIHPDRSGEAGWSFSLGVLAWEVLSGADPFADESGEDRRERIRRGILIPLDAIVPGVEENAEAVIRKALREYDEREVPDFDEWNRLIHRWVEKGIIANLTESELEERKIRAERRQLSIEKGLGTRRWFRKSGWKLAAAVVAATTVLAFVSAPVRKALESPVTAGMLPVQVAETYYKAIDAMDTEVMSDCLAGKTGRDDTRMVDTIFVTTKVRQGYEGIGELPRASDWIAAGRPELPAGVWPWGITDLELKDIGNNRIEARYNLWTPPEGEPGTQPASRTVSRVDILTFVEERKSWVIRDISRITED